MKFLSQLLARLRPQATTSSDAASHITRALDAAGLAGSGPGAAVRATIDRALADAGLQAAPDRTDAPAAAGAGRFLHASFGNAHGRRDYRLYLPVGYDPDGAPRPLILMLHGCTQSAEDFATGTRMNALADRYGFLVAYPQQIGKANHAKCWNWFRPEDQRGDAGEPSVLAGIAQQVAQDHRVDPRRIFAAGLSAGAAMAVILGRTRPELIRAIGVHSGLPYASAHDVPSAFATMQGRAAPRAAPTGAIVPMILFHGDADRTVAPSNADTLEAQARRVEWRVTDEQGRSAAGQAWSRRIALDDGGTPRFERWTLHGAGHAWSGGDAAGSYTDPAGVDASAAMVEFFLRQAV